MRNVVVESNPVAQYFISGWGTMGLIWFKIAMVTIIVLIAQVIATKRPLVAQCVLNGATLFVGSVVAYSGFFACTESNLNPTSTMWGTILLRVWFSI